MGFVSVNTNWELNAVRSVVTRADRLGLYNLLSGVPKSLSGFFARPFETHLHESWTVGILISRYPYPYELVGEKVILEGLDRGVEKNFWCFSPVEFNGVVHTEETRLGIVCHWGAFLHEACERSYATAGCLSVKDIQWRDDLQMTVKERYNFIRPHLNGGTELTK